MKAYRSSLLILGLLVVAGSGSVLLNCAPTPDAEPPQTEDEVTGVNNTLGLGLVYDDQTGRVRATLKSALRSDEKLFIRVRRGVITHESQAQLDCKQLAEAPPITESALNVAAGKVVYGGPSVSKELVDLIQVYNDSRWYGGHETPEMRAEIAKGPDSIVEACVMRDGKPRAKLLTNLAYAWDRGEELKKSGTSTRSINALAGDAGGLGGDAGDGGVGDGGSVDGSGPGVPSADGGADGGAARPPLAEGQAYNTIDYANLCVQQLGEIPFFKKLSDGKYETFDCRDFAGSNGDGAPAAVAGVEGKVVPLSVNDVPQTTCDPGQSGGEPSYDCVNKCDRGMWLTASSHTGLGETASCQPGVTVTTAKNEQGSHWVLLCRKVQDTNNAGMLKTKVFNDIAMIGTNPKTGATCFFQNKENVGNDGARVTHPADVARSSAIWPSTPSSYCTENCHATDAFIHSPWIDEAVRADGKPIVPRMGSHPDFPISNFDVPYRLINGPSQGFVLPKQLVSEGAASCTTCHRVAGASFAEFANWATGTGDAYYGKITDPYKAFAKSHWMPPRLDGLTPTNFDASRWGLAVKHIRTCTDNPAAPECEFADVPSGR